MGFFMSKAEPDIWMRDKGDHCERTAVCVDDLLTVSKDPNELIEQLTKVREFKLNGAGEVSFHLGCDFFRDSDGHLCFSPCKCSEKMLANYERIYGTKPKQVHSPLPKGDHPKLDDTELLGLKETNIYQSLVGAL